MLITIIIVSLLGRQNVANWFLSSWWQTLWLMRKRWDEIMRLLEKCHSNNKLIRIVFIAFHPLHHTSHETLDYNTKLLTLKMRQEMQRRRANNGVIGRLDLRDNGRSRDGIFTVRTKTTHCSELFSIGRRIECEVSARRDSRCYACW